MSRESIKGFWADRAKITEIPRLESQVNFEKDAETADLKINTEVEVVNKELSIRNNDIVIDLGAGNGRFSILFAQRALKVVAVEYIKDFIDSIEQQAKELLIDNIELVNSAAEDFCRENYADILFVSGLLQYLDEDQYSKTISNISKTLKDEGVLFIREAVSVLESEFVVDKFSEELNAYYYSKYRTSDQHISAFRDSGFVLEKTAPFFEDGSILNKRVETRLHYFIFSKGSLR